MRTSQADLYCSLDDDSWFLRNDALRLGIEQFFANERLAALGYDILEAPRTEERPLGVPIPASSFVGCGHILRLHALRKVGYYHILPGNYGGEESGLCLRLMDSGFDILRYPGLHVWHDKSMQSRNILWQRTSRTCNDLIGACRLCPMPDLLWAVPAKIIKQVYFSVKFGCTPYDAHSEVDQKIIDAIGKFGFISPTLLGIWKAALNLYSTLRERAPVHTSTYRHARKLERSGR